MKKFGVVVLGAIFMSAMIMFGLGMGADITKRLIGKQDHRFWDGGATDTFTGLTSTGRTITLSDIDWMGVDVEQVYGSRSGANIATVATAIGAVNKRKIWLAPGAWTLSADITTTSNIEVEMAPGAKLTCGTYDWAINGPFIGSDDSFDCDDASNSGYVDLAVTTAHVRY